MAGKTEVKGDGEIGGGSRRRDGEGGIVKNSGENEMGRRGCRMVVEGRRKEWR